MTRMSTVLCSACAIVFGALSPAGAEDQNAQLAASAGVEPAEAAGLNLAELAVYKFNRDNGDGITPIRQPTVPADPARHAQLFWSAGVDPATALSLNDLFGYKMDRENVDSNSAAPSGGRGPIPVDPVAHAQLIAAVGLTPAETEGLTLGALGELKARGDSGW